MSANTKYTDIECKLSCNKISRDSLPYDWDLNIYRGCIHECKYCYALYSHKYMNENNGDDFFKNIFVKTNIVERLEEHLKKHAWKKEVINLGGVCDSYQEIEAQKKFMPEILKLLIKYKNPIVISTKSDLILRDFDLLDELSRNTFVNIAMTITTTDENIRKLIEPNASPSIKRFEALKELKKTKASIGVHTMPIIPYITDNKKNIESLFINAKEINADYLLTGTLYLRGPTRDFFLNFIKESFPNLYQPILELFSNKDKLKEYRKNIHQNINGLRKIYGVPMFTSFDRIEKPAKQLSLL